MGGKKGFQCSQHSSFLSPHPFNCLDVYDGGQASAQKPREGLEQEGLLGVGSLWVHAPNPSPLRKKLQLLMLGPFQYAFLKIALTLVGLFLIPDGIYIPADVSQE